MSNPDGTAAETGRPQRFRARPSSWPRYLGRKAGTALRTTTANPARHIPAMVVVGLACTAGAVGALMATFGTTMEPFGFADVLNLGLAVIAGIGGIGAFAIAYCKQRTVEQDRTRIQAAELRENTKLFNERFGAAAAQLATAEPTVRLAGVHALAGLADDWDAGRQTCINVLCGYLRMPYTPPEALPADPSPEQVETHRRATEDRQVRRAIMDTIGDHLRVEPIEGTTWHGHHFDLTGATLDAGDLHGIRLSTGTVLDFTGARFPSGIIDFRGAEPAGGTIDLTGVALTDSTIDLTGVALTNSTIDLTGADLTNSTIHLGWAKLLDGTITGHQAELTGSTIDLSGTALFDGIIDFGEATLTGSTIDFSRAELFDGIIDFGEATLTNSTIHFFRAVLAATRLDFRQLGFGGTVDLRGLKLRGYLANGTVRFNRSLFSDCPDKPPPGLLLPKAARPAPPEGHGRE